MRKGERLYTYVMAENYLHFVYYCNQCGIRPNRDNHKYVGSPSDLWGVDPNYSRFITYETFPRHPQYSSIRRELRVVLSKGRTQMPNDNFWYRLINLDPALFRGLVVAVVALLATLGVTIAPGVPDQVIAIVWLLSAIIQALWTRGGVTPNAKVAVSVPDPINEPEKVEAGGAVTTAPNHEIIAAATTQG